VPDLFVDVAALLDGGLPDAPAPLSCRRDDGHALFYAGQVNVVFGDAEAGKTFLALAAAAEALRDGRRVLVLDMDHNGPAATIERLLGLGAPLAALTNRDRFRYVEPDDALNLTAIVSVGSTWAPAVTVVDSVGELLPLLGLSSNSPDDFTAAHARVLKPLAMAGSAVIAVDHLAKNTDSRASGPTGTAAKRRAIGGVALRVTVKDAFTPGHGGKATLTVNKDRHGGLRRHCPTGDREPYAGTFVLTEHDDGTLSWHVSAPRDGEHAPILGTSADDLATLTALDPPPKSVRDIKDRLGWGSDRATNGLQAWRSAVPDTAGAERGTPCGTCGDPLDSILVDAGEQTHASCEVAA
jgi:hypothetical protein